MRFPIYLLGLSVLTEIAIGRPTLRLKNTTLFLCSDSTAMDYDPETSPIQGFGYYLPDYFSASLNFTNRARGGRSTRSFINEGLWVELLDMLTPGDYVVIEMGHNDNGTPGEGSDVGKDRATLPGIGDEVTVVTNSSGLQETVKTFGAYLRQMVSDVKTLGAVPVLSGMVPTMKWTDNTTLETKWNFTKYAREVAEYENVSFLDHTKYSVYRQQQLGYTAALAMYPLNDSTHTDAKGARINAEAFVTAIKCFGDELERYFDADGEAIRYPC
ncbi:hypothetical protein RUND412_006657 [Rhizina undulata]